MDKEMYFHMDRASENIVIDRGMALHKMIRLMTISTGGQAYLNFMGNEFGHPEWIDFPREGNGWSYAHARRQWSLARNGFLRYAWLGDFDRAMIRLVKKYKVLADGYPWNLLMDERNKTMAFSHGDLLFVFNWHPSASIPDYELPVQAPGKYVPVLSTDENRFGGQERQSMAAEHFSFDAGEGDGQRQPPYPHLQHLAHGDGLPAKKVVTQRLYFPFYSPKQIYHISLKELREGFYQCRRFEATNLWRRSFLFFPFFWSFVSPSTRSAGVRNPDRRTRSGQFPGAERSRLRGGAARNVVRPDLDHDGQGVESLVRGLRTLHIRDRTGGSRRTENSGALSAGSLAAAPGR